MLHISLLLLSFVVYSASVLGYEVIKDVMHPDALRVRVNLMTMGVDGDNQRRLRSDDENDNNVITFHAFDRHFNIELTRRYNDNELFSDEFHAYSVHADGSIHEEIAVDRNCIVEGRVKNYNSELNNHVTLSICHGSVIGVIHAFGEEYYINPESAFIESSTNVVTNEKYHATTVISRRRDLESKDDMKTCGNDESEQTVSFDAEQALKNDVQHMLRAQNVKGNVKEVTNPDGGSKTKYVKLGLVSDFERFTTFGSSRSRILSSAIAIAAQIKDIYLNYPISSGYYIRVQIVSFISFENGNPWGTLSKSESGEISSSELLSKFNSWRTSALNSKLLPASTVAHLLSGNNFESTVVGLAGLSQACSNYYGSGVNQAISTIDQFVGKIVAHELGHNIGMRHTNVYIPGSEVGTPDAATACSGSYNVMSASLLSGVGTFTWDKCSIAWFKMYLRGYPYDCTASNSCTYTKGYGSSSTPSMCLEEKSLNPILEGSVCGDGILDDGEECDCGNEEQCKEIDPCCDPSTCKLQPTAKCSATDPCCDTDTCDFVPASAKQVCRASLGQCDTTEMCNGRSSKCPADVYKPLGQTCTLTSHRSSDDANGITREGICYKGECMSHESQCMYLKEKGFYSDIDGECSRAGDEDGDLSCSKLYCKRVNTEYCGTNYYTPDLAYVKDGTPCGEKRVCINSICVTYDPVGEESNPTTNPTPSVTIRTPAPTSRPTRQPNMERLTTSSPTSKPKTSVPTVKPRTSSPTKKPQTKFPTKKPVATKSPTIKKTLITAPSRKKSGRILENPYIE